MNKKIVVDYEHSKATITINHPQKHNRLTKNMWLDIETTLHEIEKKSDVRVCIIRGYGGIAFCAGADINEIIENIDNIPKQCEINEIIQRTQKKLETLSCPTVAVIEGSCYGGGLGLAISCDFRLASSSSTFALTPAKLGLCYSIQDTHRLYRLVGSALTKEMLYTARVFSSNEAFERGLINYIHPNAEFEKSVDEFISQLASASSYSQRYCKSVIAYLEGSNEMSKKDLDVLYHQSFNGKDCREGLTAFLEKRAPNFDLLP